MYRLNRFIVCIAALGLVACQTTSVKEEVATAQLPPMQEPQRAAGLRMAVLRDGVEGWSGISSMQGSVAEWKLDNGCISLGRGETWPAEKWTACKPYTDGEQKVTLNGEIYPLTVGKKWSFNTNGRNVKGETWTNQRNCEVKGVVRITTVTGAHDTYKVVCDQRGSSRTWYMSPSAGQVVAFERNDNRHGREYVEFKPAQSS